MLQDASASSTAATSGSAEEQLPWEEWRLSPTRWFASDPSGDLTADVCRWEPDCPAPLAMRLSGLPDGPCDLNGPGPASFLQAEDDDDTDSDDDTDNDEEDEEDEEDDEEDDGGDNEDDIPLDWPDEQDDFEEFDEDDFDDDFDDDFEEEIEDEEFKESEEEFGFSYHDSEEEE